VLKRINEEEWRNALEAGAKNLQGPVDPYLLAETMGTPVSYTKDLSGALGVTDGLHIWIRAGLRPSVERSTLAHELAHVLLGHTSCQDTRGELRANRLAARLLLDPDTVSRERAYCSSLSELADALGTDVDLASWGLDECMTSRPGRDNRTPNK
jgi:Zn-dependent peptidase ImmA (M78 family)